ncbi:VOC family protein [Parafrankia sp. FMc2]|uniref:VOC family protein n=1 Tax=Parafrankia sp. FMc2 TaxID=3233196 RepID=UPI0034D4564D
MSDSVPPPQVWPCLRARDARALIDFLAAAFGFEEVVCYGGTAASPESPARVDHAELAWPEGGGIMLGTVRGGTDDPFALTPGAFGAYVVTADPDGLCARARAAGARITVELHDTDYGSRDFAARDPEGNLWSFGTYPGAPRKD